MLSFRLSLMKRGYTANELNNDRDLSGKDTEIAELESRFHEFQDKSQSLEIDLVTENVRVDTSDEARDVTPVAMNVTQDNYPEVQAMVEPLVDNSVWLQQHCIVHASLLRCKKTYKKLALPVMDLVSEALQHNDYVACLKSIFELAEGHEREDEDVVGKEEDNPAP
ncbi:hypothetical protein Hanom_Chr17g01566131 [Helianthus anomalus]